MQVLGQFNKGFIIAADGADLYIVDQHASDEKARFESLRENTVLHQQPLVVPMRMELSPAEEQTVLEHRDGVYARNGFRFVLDESRPAGQRLSMSAAPFSKKVHLGI